MLITGQRVSQTGTNLIELMIGSALGLIVLSAVTAFYADTAQKTRAGLEQAHLNHDIHAALFLMTRDIRRAGYRATQPGHSTLNSNPFNYPQNALQIAQYRGESANSCIIFSYDLNGDGKVGIGSAQVGGTLYSNTNQERFGFRLRNGAIQMRSGGRQFDCASGRWQSITEPDVTIELLQFSLTEDCLNLLSKGIACTTSAPAQFIRMVNVQLSGHLASDPRVKVALAETVHVRNHFYRPPVQ